MLIFDQSKSVKLMLPKFELFEESEIAFLPTYKMDRETGEYLETYDQAPAWTDRITWSHSKINDLNCNYYTSIEGIKFSNNELYPEHNPVVGSWEVEVKKIDKDVRLSCNRMFLQNEGTWIEEND